MFPVSEMNQMLQRQMNLRSGSRARSTGPRTRSVSRTRNFANRDIDIRGRSMSRARSVSRGRSASRGRVGPGAGGGRGGRSRSKSGRSRECSVCWINSLLRFVTYTNLAKIRSSSTKFPKSGLLRSLTNIIKFP